MRTSDGRSLRVDVRATPGRAVGVAVLAHALMARRSEFERPSGEGLGAFLSARGWRVITFDFRCHGESSPSPRRGGTFGYDDLVERDLPAVCAFAREELGRGLPLVLVGHSLGGHVALAAQGTGAVQADAVAALAATVWTRRLDSSHLRFWAKRAAVGAMVSIARRVGYFPARALRLGSDDEPRELIDDIARFVRSGEWSSRTGRVDYIAAVRRIEVPVLQVLSERDAFECDAESGMRLVEGCARRTIVRIGASDNPRDPPSHMGLVTSGSRAVRARLETWMRESARARG